MVIDEVVDERTLREIYLTAFEMAVKEGKAGSLMSSYNRLNGVHANENVHLLVDILRKEWGFTGMVVTDWAGCNSRVEGLKCGNELEMPSCKASNNSIVTAVQNGELDENVLDEAVDNFLDFVFKYHNDGSVKEFDKEANHNLAERAAEESVVLLKNDGVLPLKQEKVAFVGDFVKNPRYQGAGSSVVNPTKLDTTLDVMEESGLNFAGYEQGFDRYGKKKDSLLKKAVELAQKADVVVYYMGLDEVTEAEGLDRENMKLPQNQLEVFDALKATGKKIVVVLSCGSAVEMDFADKADAIVHAYLGGQASPRAVLGVISGRVNPSGKLSETIPFKYEDCSVANYFPGRQNASFHKEGLYIGYRYYDTAGIPVRFPFGFGLSYTSYEYSDLEVGDDGVTFTVKNTGDVDGKEVTQLYISLKGGKIFRPAKELKGFKKVFVKSGESVKVTIPFDDKTFRYFNVKTNKWEIEGGEYDVLIGASVADIRLSGKIKVKGTTDVNPYEGIDLPSYVSGKVQNVSDEEFERLLGRELPPLSYDFIKKNRIVIHENCTVEQLRYAKGWTGRAFSGVIRFAISFLRKIGNRTMANTLVMGVLHQPMRGLQKFGGMTDGQINGLMTMFNGKFFKGLGMFIKK